MLFSAPSALEAFTVSFASWLVSAVEASCACPKPTDTSNTKRRTDVTPEYLIFIFKTSIIFKSSITSDLHFSFSDTNST
jgi:hypothetical protein